MDVSIDSDPAEMGITVSQRRCPSERPLRGGWTFPLDDHDGEGFRMPSGVGKPPKHEPAALGSWSSPVRRLAAARCVRFVAWRMVAWEPAVAGRQQLSADPNVERTLGHSLQRWCCGVT
jgi:hypothetical protein